MLVVPDPEPEPEPEPLELDEQDSCSEVITPETGRFNEEMGVPGGTFTTKVYVFPVRVLIVIVHESAAALGSADPRRAASAAPTSASRISALRLFSNFALLPGNHQRVHTCPENPPEARRSAASY